MERDVLTYSKNNDDDISTHTLTWSVTVIKAAMFQSKSISTHTLTWSVTKAETAYAKSGNISTHTLTWSVTLRTNDL